MRPRALLAQLLGLAAAVVTAGASCDIPELIPETSGSVDVGFIQVGTATVSQVRFEVSGNGITPIDGVIDVSDGDSTPSAFVGGIPSGLGYTLELWASEDDAQDLCYGTSSFDVAAGQSATVQISLVCMPMEAVHTILVNGMTDYCPTLASYVASPPSGTVGGAPLTLTASAHSYYSDPLKFTWTASSGDLSSPDTAVSQYTCTAPGVQQLTVTVTDGNCPDSAAFSVTCAPSTKPDPSDN